MNEETAIKKKNTSGKALNLTSSEIRQRFLTFFEKRGHAVIPSAPLVPENDPSVLFNTAGMQPIVPYLMGQKHPMGKRLVDAQKCVRTNDIEEVGDKTHFTFFEMLGNWSLGDYFKEDAIKWSYEFLTSKKEGLGLDPERLYVTIFEGDDDVPKDNEAYAIWKNIVGPERIYTSVDDNWWQAGENGPCGPDTEMFYDRTKLGLGLMSQKEFRSADERQDVVEIWNDVFMEYEKKDDKIVGKLPKQNVDTGAGLERVTAILQDKESPYETDLFTDFIKHLEKNSATATYASHTADFRVTADHLRAATFLIADGVRPSNKDQGYILRRLLRRAMVKMNNISFDTEKTGELISIVVAKYGDVYTNLKENEEVIKSEVQAEISKFANTLEKGLREFKKMIDPETDNNHIKKLDFGMCEVEGHALNELSGSDAFKLFTTYGFPYELIREEAGKCNIIVDEEGFKELLKGHQESSKTASAGKFKGGLGGDSPKITAFHTATHLLLEGLRRELGEHVEQRGSNITEERARFDFSNPEKVQREALDKVELYMNNAVAKGAKLQ